MEEANMLDKFGDAYKQYTTRSVVGFNLFVSVETYDRLQTYTLNDLNHHVYPTGLGTRTLVPPYKKSSLIFRENTKTRYKI
jgi:hypothetical protein